MLSDERFIEHLEQVFEDAMRGVAYLGVGVKAVAEAAIAADRAQGAEPEGVELTDAEIDEIEGDCIERFLYEHPVNGTAFGQRLNKVKFARAVIAADRAARAEPVAIHQFRNARCADWYDGVPDHEDGRGPYEERTLYTAQPAAPVDPDDVAKDAERYRWMRSNWTTMHSVATDTTLKLLPGDEPWAGFGPDVIDSAIDSAMLASSPNPETPT